MPPLYTILYARTTSCYWFDTKSFPPIRIEICDLSIKDFMPFTQNKTVSWGFSLLLYLNLFCLCGIRKGILLHNQQILTYKRIGE